MLSGPKNRSRTFSSGLVLPAARSRSSCLDALHRQKQSPTQLSNRVPEMLEIPNSIETLQYAIDRKVAED